MAAAPAWSAGFAHATGGGARDRPRRSGRGGRCWCQPGADGHAERDRRAPPRHDARRDRRPPGRGRRSWRSGRGSRPSIACDPSGKEALDQVDTALAAIGGVESLVGLGRRFAALAVESRGTARATAAWRRSRPTGGSVAHARPAPGRPRAGRRRSGHHHPQESYAAGDDHGGDAARRSRARVPPAPSPRRWRCRPRASLFALGTRRLREGRRRHPGERRPRLAGGVPERDQRRRWGGRHGRLRQHHGHSGRPGSADPGGGQDAATRRTCSRSSCRSTRSPP